MRVLLFISISLSVIAGVQLLSCVKDYCKTHPCTTPDSCPSGQGLLSNFCSCCKQCVPLIPKGEPCLNLFGVPQRTRCEDVDPTNFLPETTTYWTYQGSLTAPPCLECVVWILFKNPVEVSQEQLQACRTIRNYCYEGTCPCDEFEGFVKENFRPRRELHECTH
ncbi:hypothetical protein RN001_015305 [Aquatica leii]|uniref:carbonic anhydrase n=1 Tax=Aquatica leii TaxID=1421715 RepID=A0AAN7P375_9COLE|nr:hypothetical protein RN001_015305 [Aquatica leii]